MERTSETNRIRPNVATSGFFRPLAARLGFIAATAIPLAGCANARIETKKPADSIATSCSELRNSPNALYLNDNRWASLSTVDGQVMVQVCAGNNINPTNTQLISFSGDKRGLLANQSAAELTEAIASGRLFTANSLMTNGQTNYLGLRPSWVPGWTPSILVVPTSTLADFSGLPASDRREQSERLVNNLWRSGLMPSDRTMATLQIIQLESELHTNCYGDRQLRKFKELATLNQSIGEFDQTERWLQPIMGYRYKLTEARPLYYHEAVFLSADAKRIQALQNNQPKSFEEISRLLRENQAQLKSLEYGYKTRYSLEMLRSCRMFDELLAYHQQASSLEGCGPADVATHLDNATGKYNLYAPKYDDYFIAVRAMLEGARIKLITAQKADGPELREAIALYDQVLATINENQRPAGIIDGLAKVLRVSTGSNQFDSKNFKLFEAQAQRGKGLAEMKLASLSDGQSDRETHLAKAIENLKAALTTAKYIKSENILHFHTGGLFEERQAYHDIIGDYAETLLNLYYEKEKNHPGSGAVLFADNALEGMDLAGDTPLETSYLRAALTLGNLNSQAAYVTGDANRFARADELYSVLKNSQQAAEPKQVTDYHRFLFAVATFRSAEIFIAWPRVKSAQEVEAQLLSVDSGLNALIALSSNPAEAKRYEYFLNAAMIVKADLLLAQVDRDPTGPKADRLAKVENLFLGIKASTESYQSLKAQVKLIEIAIRRNDFEELDGQRKKVSTNKASGLIGNGEAILGNLDPTHSLRYPLIMSLSTLYIYRNGPTDADRVIALNDEILNNSHELTEPFKTYVRTYAALNRGTAMIQKGLNIIAEDIRIVKTGQIHDTVESTIDLIKTGVAQLVDQENNVLPKIKELEDQLAWDTHSLRAELFQQLAIAYSMLEKRESTLPLSERQYSMKTYQYVQRAYYECATSPNPLSYERETRPKLLAKSFADPATPKSQILNAYDLNNPYPIHPEFANLMAVNDSFAPLRDNQQNQAWGNWQHFIDKNNLVIDLGPDHAKEIFTERTGYGMFLANYFGNNQLAEQLFTAIEQRAKNMNGLYSWRLHLDGSVDKKESAFDADLYITYSLTVMGSQPARQQELIDKLWEKTIVERGGRLIIKPSDGNWPEHGDGQVVFNPSYFAPHLIKTIAKADKNAAQHNWQKVIDDGYELMNETLRQSGTLKASGPNPIPDQLLCQVVGGNFVLSQDNDKKQDGLDSIRVMLEIGRDAIINQDPRAVQFLRELLAKANINSSSTARLQSMNNELAIALYAVAVKGAGDPNHNLNTFTSRLNASFRGDHFGMRTNGLDGKDYYKQSLILMARMLLQ